MSMTPDEIRAVYKAYLAKQKSSPMGLLQRGDTKGILQDPSRSQVASWVSTMPEVVSVLSGPGPDESMSSKTAQVLSTGLKQAANAAGVDSTVSQFISPLVSLAGGDTEGAVRQGTGSAAGTLLRSAGVPGLLVGPASGTLAGLAMGDSDRKLAENAVNSGVGALASLFGPVGSVLYSLARMGGLNVAQGAGESMDMYAGLTPGYEGGYWGRQGLGDGVSSDAQTGLRATSDGLSISPLAGLAQYTPASFSSWSGESSDTPSSYQTNYSQGPGSNLSGYSASSDSGDSGGGDKRGGLIRVRGGKRC